MSKSKETPLRALVVDDDESMCELLSAHLEEEGYEVFIALDGHEGFKQTLRLYPDVIISDEWMPKMSGTELLVKVRLDPLLKQTPFVLLSAHYDNARVKFSLQVGANEYLPKPFQAEDLLARVKRAMIPPPPSSRSVMKGDLKFFSLPDVLVMTHQNRQTGLLRVEDEPGTQRFHFLFEEGSLVWASGPAEVKGIKAFNRSLRIVEGRFRFTPWERFNRQDWHASLNVNSMLLSGIQEVDEIPLITSGLPDGVDTRFMMAPDQDSEELEADGVLAPFLEQGWQSATFQELLDVHEEIDLELAKELKRHLDKGVVTIIEARG